MADQGFANLNRRAYNYGHYTTCLYDETNGVLFEVHDGGRPLGVKLKATAPVPGTSSKYEYTHDHTFDDNTVLKYPTCRYALIDESGELWEWGKHPTKYGIDDRTFKTLSMCLVACRDFLADPGETMHIHSRVLLPETRESYAGGCLSRPSMMPKQRGTIGKSKAKSKMTPRRIMSKSGGGR